MAGTPDKEPAGRNNVEGGAGRPSRTQVAWRPPTWRRSIDVVASDKPNGRAEQRSGLVFKQLQPSSRDWLGLVENPPHALPWPPAIRPLHQWLLRQKQWTVHVFLFMSEPSYSLAATLFSYAMMGVVLLSSVTFVLSTVASIEAAVGDAFNVIETVCVIVFTADYALRLLTCPYSWLHFAIEPLNIVDLVSIVPWYIGLALQSDSASTASVFRVLRLLRVFRVMRLARGSQAWLVVITQTLANSREVLLVLLVSMSILLVLLATLMNLLERGEMIPDLGYYARENEPVMLPSEAGPPRPAPSPFASVPQGFWWAIVTMLTVGYGDTYPITPGGKAVACVAMMTGVLTLALPIGVIGTTFTSLWVSHQERARAALAERVMASSAPDGVQSVEEQILVEDAIGQQAPRHTLLLPGMHKGTSPSVQGLLDHLNEHAACMEAVLKLQRDLLARIDHLRTRVSDTVRDALVASGEPLPDSPDGCHARASDLLAGLLAAQPPVAATKHMSGLDLGPVVKGAEGLHPVCEGDVDNVASPPSAGLSRPSGPAAAPASLVVPSTHTSDAGNQPLPALPDIRSKTSGLLPPFVEVSQARASKPAVEAAGRRSALRSSVRPSAMGAAGQDDWENSLQSRLDMRAGLEGSSGGALTPGQKEVQEVLKLEAELSVQMKQLKNMQQAIQLFTDPSYVSELDRLRDACRAVLSLQQQNKGIVAEACLTDLDVLQLRVALQQSRMGGCGPLGWLMRSFNRGVRVIPQGPEVAASQLTEASRSVRFTASGSVPQRESVARTTAGRAVPRLWSRRSARHAVSIRLVTLGAQIRQCEDKDAALEVVRLQSKHRLTPDPAR